MREYKEPPSAENFMFTTIERKRAISTEITPQQHANVESFFRAFARPA